MAFSDELRRGVHFSQLSVVGRRIDQYCGRFIMKVDFASPQPRPKKVNSQLLRGIFRCTQPHRKRSPKGYPVSLICGVLTRLLFSGISSGATCKTGRQPLQKSTNNNRKLPWVRVVRLTIAVVFVSSTCYVWGICTIHASKSPTSISFKTSIAMIIKS